LSRWKEGIITVVSMIKLLPSNGYKITSTTLEVSYSSSSGSSSSSDGGDGGGGYKGFD